MPRKTSLDTRLLKKIVRRLRQQCFAKTAMKELGFSPSVVPERRAERFLIATLRLGDVRDVERTYLANLARCAKVTASNFGGFGRSVT